MNILNYFYSIFENIINLYRVDFFNFGFTYLQFILGALLLIVVIGFYKSFSHQVARTGVFRLKHPSYETHKLREQQLVNYIKDKYDYKPKHVYQAKHSKN